jgi:CBS domain-containing protein
MRPVVTTVERCAHLAAVAYLMRRSHETALVVIADHVSQRPVAIVTAADVAQAVAEGMDVNEARIAELVGTQLITVQPETAVSDAIALMVSAGIRQLPVIEANHLVGILVLTDAYRTVSGADASAQPKASAP